MTEQFLGVWGIPIGLGLMLGAFVVLLIDLRQNGKHQQQVHELEWEIKALRLKLQATEDIAGMDPEMLKLTMNSTYARMQEINAEDDLTDALADEWDYLLEKNNAAKRQWDRLGVETP